MNNNVLLEVKKINKEFPGVKALKDVDLKILENEVHGLTGENGAGKSTLMKILMGIYTPDSGEILFKGEKIKLNGVSEAQNFGINMVFQELNLFPDLSILENVFVKREIIKEKTKLYDWKKMYHLTKKYLQTLKLNLDPLTKIKDLSVANKQMVEITRAISTNSKLIIMDEPTSSLSDKEVEHLYEAIDILKKEGIAVIYISHKLEEIVRICNRVTVLRNGEVVKNYENKDLSIEKMIGAMLGKTIKKEGYPKVKAELKDEILRVENLSYPPVFSDITFSLKQGEILGLLGLVGAGRTDIAKAIFGVQKTSAGEIYLNNKKASIKSPQDAMKLGIAYVSEDRKNEELFLKRDIKENITVTNVDRILKKTFFINHKTEKNIVIQSIKDLNIATPSYKQKVNFLSGGNQQKVCLAKWFFLDPKIMILDEPTRGIDVGAKAEIYQIIGNLARQGMAILLISSEIEEILGVSDRVLVVNEGSITGEFSRENFSDRNSIMESMMGVKNHIYI